MKVKDSAPLANGVEVPAVAKAIAIVRFLNSRPSAGATLGQIVDHLGITRSHCHNILRTLVANAWVEYGATTRLYRLSSGVAADSSTALYARTQLAAVRPFVDKLFDRVGLQCFLSEPLADGSFLIVHSIDEADAYLFRAPVGYRFPPGTAALFKAKLAWLPAAQIDEALAAWTPTQHSRTSIMDRDAMRAELLASRQRGYALSLGEYIEGFDTIALPIFDREGNVILTLGISGMDDTFRKKQRTLVEALTGAASAIHLAIDGRPPVDSLTAALAGRAASAPSLPAVAVARPRPRPDAVCPQRSAGVCSPRCKKWVEGGNIMTVEALIIWIVVGIVAGWLASLVVRGGGFGLVGDLIVGIIGALIAGWLFPTLGISLGGGIIGAIIAAAIGAIILLAVLRLVKRA